MNVERTNRTVYTILRDAKYFERLIRIFQRRIEKTLAAFAIRWRTVRYGTQQRSTDVQLKRNGNFILTATVYTLTTLNVWLAMFEDYVDRPKTVSQIDNSANFDIINKLFSLFLGQV